MIFLKLIFVLFNINNDIYTIEKIYDNHIFYNFIVYDDNLYVGSNNGIYEIDILNSNKLLLFDEDVKGPINSDFSFNNNYKVTFLEPNFNIKPPIKLDGITDFSYFDDNLYVIRRGVLSTFKLLDYEFTPYESVRSITQNTIGSYNGIYVNDKKLSKVKFTDGQIQEFDNLIFVCYKGLLSVENEEERVVYKNISNKRTKNEYGKIYDIYLIDYPNFLVLSENGLYNYNHDNSKFNLLYLSESKNNPIIPINQKTDDNKLKSSFSFIQGDSYNILNLDTYNITNFPLNSNYNITDTVRCDAEAGIIYAISENKYLIKLSLNINSKKFKLLDKTTIDLTAHTISSFKNLIFLSGNNGLSIYEKNKAKMYSGFIKDEFNKDAVYLNDSQITFGSINGIYEFNDLNDFAKNLIIPDFKLKKFNNYPIIIFFSLLALVLIFLIFLNKSKANKNISKEILIQKIKTYIKKNLNIVTIKTLEEEFDIDYYQINKLDYDFNPGAYIKMLRNVECKKMFLNNKSIGEISKKTGYSESYLIKNKTRFINKKFKH